MNFEINGLDNLKKSLSEIKENLKEIDEKKDIPIAELLTNSYLKKNTKFKDLNEVFNTYKNNMTEMEISKILESEEWDSYIRENTKFKSWAELLKDATMKWIEVKVLGKN